MATVGYAVRGANSAEPVSYWFKGGELIVVDPGGAKSAAEIAKLLNGARETDLAPGDATIVVDDGL